MVTDASFVRNETDTLAKEHSASMTQGGNRPLHARLPRARGNCPSAILSSVLQPDKAGCQCQVTGCEHKEGPRPAGAGALLRRGSWRGSPCCLQVTPGAATRAGAPEIPKQPLAVFITGASQSVCYLHPRALRPSPAA